MLIIRNKEFPVIVLGVPLMKSGKIENRIAVWENRYGKDKRRVTLGDRFAYVLNTGYRTMVNGEERLLENHRELLKGFYSVFKAADRGVTKFS